MKEFTQRQVWKVLRNLVSNNNAEIKRTFASSLVGTYNMLAQKSNIDYSSPQFVSFKNSSISSGVKDIYIKIANKFFEQDKDAMQKYFKLNSEGANWQDSLSPRDLFYLYNFQNRVLSSFDKA